MILKKQQSRVSLKRKRDSDQVQAHFGHTPKNEMEFPSNKRQKSAGLDPDNGASSPSPMMSRECKESSSAPVSEVDSGAIDLLLAISLASTGAESPKEEPPVVVKKNFRFADIIAYSRYFDKEAPAANVQYCLKQIDNDKLTEFKSKFYGNAPASTDSAPSDLSADKVDDTDKKAAKETAVKPLVGILKITKAPSQGAVQGGRRCFATRCTARIPFQQELRSNT